MTEVNITKARILLDVIGDWQGIMRGWEDFQASCETPQGKEDARKGILSTTCKLIELKDELVGMLYGVIDE